MIPLDELRERYEIIAEAANDAIITVDNALNRSGRFRVSVTSAPSRPVRTHGSVATVDMSSLRSSARLCLESAGTRRTGGVIVV